MTKKKKIKESNYQKLFGKIDSAIESDFYLEASWMIYSIIEDRFRSLVNNSAKTPAEKKRKILMLGPKIGIIEDRLKTNSNLQSVFYDDLLERVNNWKKSRDKLMHAMAEESVPIEDLNKEIYLTASNGEQIAKDLCTRARKLKKLNK